MRRVPAVLAVLLASAAALAGCSAPPPPAVTFYSDGAAARTLPQVYCTVATRSCAEDATAVATLRMRAGKSVQISVDSAISDTPWVVVFSYQDAAGNRVDGSSALFFPKDGRLAYTLELPEREDRLVLADVQQLAVVDGDQPVITGHWTLRAEAA